MIKLIFPHTRHDKMGHDMLLQGAMVQALRRAGADITGRLLFLGCNGTLRYTHENDDIEGPIHVLLWVGEDEPWSPKIEMQCTHVVERGSALTGEPFTDAGRKYDGTYYTVYSNVAPAAAKKPIDDLEDL